MVTSIIFTEGTKQIVLTPENETDKIALKSISAEDRIELLKQFGQFGEPHFKPFSANVNTCQAKYLRIYQDNDSRILVFRPFPKAPVVENQEIGISLNDRCKEMINEYINGYFEWMGEFAQEEVRKHVTILVEKCIYSDNHD